jgi:cytochrome c
MKMGAFEMPSLRYFLVGAIAVSLLGSWASAREFGRTPTLEEIRLWDIDVRPDGRGLPKGSGGVSRGREVYTSNCEGCHGKNGQGGIKDRLAGGIGTLASGKPIKTVGSYWPYATTLFDYIRRAMPYTAPGSLNADDLYAVTAYILNINGILPDDGTLNLSNLPKIKMPNRDGFLPDNVFQVDNENHRRSD